MSSEEIAIRVENISKCYQIYERPLNRLKQFIFPRLQKMLGYVDKKYYQEFWALKDISFEVKKGQIVGVIGRNGSGKSTLLQAICGTLSPTSGSIYINGRIAAILELGSGFNPEFTGRENVYLNASLFGLSTSQIDIRYQAILNFADIGDFINQPVKTYSSGMLVRLAFAVIANVDADILVVDEALAVGDAIFTQKCMSFIREFSKKGTILFVSHDISSIQSLCNEVVWIDCGKMRLSGASKKVAESYLQFTFQKIYGDQIILKDLPLNKTECKNLSPELNLKNQAIYDSEINFSDTLKSSSGWETGHGNVLSVEIMSLEDGGSNIFKGGEEIKLSIRAKANRKMLKPMLGFLFRDRLGQDLFGENTSICTKRNPISIEAGQEIIAEFIFVLPHLQNGKYFMMVSLAEGEIENHIQHHWLNEGLTIDVSSSKVRWGIVGVPFRKIDLQVVSESF